MTAGRLPAPRYAVVSEHALVAEAVRAALRERSLDAVVLKVPTPGEPCPRSRRPFAAGLLMSDLDRWSSLQRAQELLAAVPTHWVVLTDAPRGPEWGVVAEGGAVAVLPSNAPLDRVATCLVAAGRDELRLPAVERHELVEDWRELCLRRAELQSRVRTLTRRERQVLDMLYAGDSVAHIAHLLEVSPATVRSQVKAVLRKLGVGSQLAAVAALSRLLEDESPSDSLAR